MPRATDVQLSGPEAFRHALRDQGRSLRERYRDDPIGLAERLGLKLPRKPGQVMADLGIYDEERFGPLTPGIRELVEDVCSLNIRDAVAVGPRWGW